MQGYPAGFARALLFYTDATYGCCIGQGATLANGSDSGAYVASNVKTAGLTPVEPTNLNIEGGDRIVATMQFGNAKQQTFQMTLSDIDTALFSMISGATPNTSNNSTSTLFSDNPNLTSPAVLGIGLQQRYKLTSGLNYFLTRWIPRAEVRIRPGNMAFQAGSDVTVDITPSLATRTVMGQLFSSATNGVAFGLEGDSTDVYYEATANPIMIHAQRSNASLTTFTAGYKPLSSVVTVNASSNEMAKNGVPTALTSFSLTTKLVTLTAAGTAADIHVLKYETAFVS